MVSVKEGWAEKKGSPNLLVERYRERERERAVKREDVKEKWDRWRKFYHLRGRRRRRRKGKMMLQLEFVEATQGTTRRDWVRDLKWSVSRWWQDSHAWVMPGQHPGQCQFLHRNSIRFASPINYIYNLFN